MHRTERSIINLATGFILQIILLGISFVSTPLIVHWLGDVRYGAFRTASDWGNYLSLLELGISGSLLSLLAKASGVGDRQLIRLTLATGIRAYINITLIMLVAAIGFGFFITRIIPLKADLVGELQTGYWLGILGIFFFPLTPFRLLTDASQRSYLTNIFCLGQNLTITGVSLLLSSLGFGIIGLYIAGLVGNIGFQIAMSWDGLRRYPGMLQNLTDIVGQEPIKKELWRLNWPTLALNLASRVSLFTDNIIISSILNPATVTKFIFTQRLITMVQLQLQIVSNATWASLADLHAKGEKEKFNTRLIELTQLIAVMGLASLISVIAYNHHFVNLWVGPQHFGGDLVTIVSAANNLMLGIFSIWGWCFSSTGTQSKLVVPDVLAAGTNLLASIICTHYLGISGPLVGTFIAYISITLWQLPRLLNQVFGTSLTRLFWAVAKPLIVGIPYGFIIWRIAQSHIPWGWLGLASEMVLTGFIYLIIAWLLVFNKNERRLFQSIMSIILAKFQRS